MISCVGQVNSWLFFSRPPHPNPPPRGGRERCCWQSYLSATLYLNEECTAPPGVLPPPSRGRVGERGQAKNDYEELAQAPRSTLVRPSDPLSDRLQPFPPAPCST